MEKTEVMDKVEIKLTEKQLEIINGIFSERAALQEQAQKIADGIAKRETEFIINLCEAKGVEAVKGIEIKDGSMFVPVPKKEQLVVSKKKKD